MPSDDRINKRVLEKGLSQMSYPTLKEIVIGLEAKLALSLSKAHGKRPKGGTKTKDVFLVKGPSDSLLPNAEQKDPGDGEVATKMKTLI